MALECRIDSECGGETHAEVDVLPLPVPEVFEGQPHERVLVIEPVQTQFNDITEAKVNQDMVPQDVAPICANVARHLKGMNQGLQRRFVITERSSVEPQPEDFGVVKRRPVAEDRDKVFGTYDAVDVLHLLRRLTWNDASR